MEDETIFDRIGGLKMIDPKTVEELTSDIEQSADKIITAVEERELLSATSIYRELEEMQHREKRC